MENRGIKVTSTGRGRFAYEDELIRQHLRELNRWMFEKDIPVVVRNVIRAIHKDWVTRETVGWIYTHPIREFYKCATKGTLGSLKGNTSRVVIPESGVSIFTPKERSDA